MRVAALLLLVACAAACSRWYRSPEDSEEMAGEISDRNVETRIRLALLDDPLTEPYTQIRVRCKDGVVTLMGVVDRAEVRNRAVQIARAARGVRDVRDSISTTSG